MKFLNHLDLVENEARRMKLYRVAAGSYTPSVSAAGNIIFDTGDSIPKWWDGSNWRDFSYGTTGTMNWNIQSDSGSNIQVDNGETLDLTGGTGISTATSGSATAPIVTVNANTWGVNSSASASADETDTNQKWYGVMTDSNDKLVVRVPWTDTSVRTVAVDTNGNGSANNTLATSETLLLSKGSNITLAESGGVVTISSTDTNTTYSMMTSSVLGLGKLFSDTTQSVSANSISETASRTYGIQKNSSNQLVVNVPWSDTNTNTNQLTTFTLTGDSGTNQTIAHNNTLDIAGGTGSSTVVGATDTVTVNVNTFGPNTSASATADETDTNQKWYAVMHDSDNKLVVRVPWTDNNDNTQATYTLPVAAGASNTAVINLTGGGAASGVASSVTFSGTANEVQVTESTGNNGTITIGLPNDVTIGNDLTVTNDCTITGDLTVNGTTTTVNSNTVNIGDSIITLNSDETGTPSQNGGIEIERGTSANVNLLWNESTDKWTVSDASNSYNIIQNVFTTVTGNSGTATANGYTTALAATGSNGITTTAANQGITISGGTMAQTSVCTLSKTSIGSATNKRATVTHGLGTKDVVVRTYLIDGDNNEEIYADVIAISTSAVTVTFSAQPAHDIRTVIVAAPNAGTASVAYA